MTTKTYHLGEHPKLDVEIRDPSTNNLVDPASTKINMADSSGALKIDDVTMTNDSTGMFHYDDYLLPSDGKTGIWTWNVVATGSDGKKTIDKSLFIVEEAL